MRAAAASAPPVPVTRPRLPAFRAIRSVGKRVSVLFEKGADQAVTPASTVKIMTAELIFRELKEGRLRLEDEFVVSENAWRTGGSPSRGSTMFAGLNTRIKIEDLLRGLLVVSGNDAAIILAEGIAGTDSAFAQKMNLRARELGFTSRTAACEGKSPTSRSANFTAGANATSSYRPDGQPE